ENLIAMRRRHDACSARQRWPTEDLVFCHLDRARVDTHAHMDRRIAPTLRGQSALRVYSREDGRVRLRERDAERVADDTERIASVSDDCFAQQRVVTLCRSAHRHRPAIPERRTALD